MNVPLVTLLEYYKHLQELVQGKNHQKNFRFPEEEGKLKFFCKLHYLIRFLKIPFTNHFRRYVFEFKGLF